MKTEMKPIQFPNAYLLYKERHKSMVSLSLSDNYSIHLLIKLFVFGVRSYEFWNASNLTHKSKLEKDSDGYNCTENA